MKYRADYNTERSLAVIAAMTVLIGSSIVRSAVGAYRLAVPSNLFKMTDAILLRGESLEDLYNVHICHTSTLYDGMIHYLGEKGTTLN